MHKGDSGIFVTTLGVNIEGEVIGEMGSLIKIRSVAGFIRMVNKLEILQFIPKVDNLQIK